MLRKKKIEVVEEVVEEQVVVEPHVVVHTDRLDGGTNNNVSEALPSLDD